MALATEFVRAGIGPIPKSRINEKTVVEVLVEDGLNQHSRMTHMLEFSDAGTTAEDFIAFIDELMALKLSKEPIVQSGGIYGVSEGINSLGAELMMFQLEHGEVVRCLEEADKSRALRMYERIFTDQRLRNRNSLHPSIVDSCLLSNLLNFVKHVFAMPYASYATNGNESLSLVLFSYLRSALEKDKDKEDPTVWYVGEEPSDVLRTVCERLTLQLQVVAPEEFASAQLTAKPVVVVASIDLPSLGAVAKRCKKNGVAVHVHVSANEFRQVLVENESLCYLQLPSGVKSVSLDAQPLLACGYAVYRDYTIRDAHIDLPEKWEALYISIHEGGSTSTQPFYRDLVVLLLGWTALRKLANSMDEQTADDHCIHINKLEPGEHQSEDAEEFEGIRARAQDLFLNQSKLSRGELEKEFVGFQTALIGGRSRPLDVTTTGGGTRSICLAFEAALARHRETSDRTSRLKVLCGNPHLAVERTARRLGFEMVRLVNNGVLDLTRLRAHISDKSVFAVFAQTLSYTDGITDPVLEALEVVEAENANRDIPIFFINDCCLALSVVIHNNGENGTVNLKILDSVGENFKTPCIVTNDPHKHFGTDKGISTVLATHGALDAVEGHIRVGAIPDKDKLITAIACTKLVGAENYRELYRKLYSSVDKTVNRVEEMGITILHKENRTLGSTVFAVEDPSGFMLRQLKKKGHEVMQLVGIHREDEEKCQTGWQLSMTVHQLRTVEGEVVALEQFLEDLEGIFESSKKQGTRGLFKENHVISYLASGNVTAYANSNLLQGGKLGAAAIRRYITATLDNGAAL